MQPAIITQPVYIEECFSPVLSSSGAIAADRRLFEVHPRSRQRRLLQAFARKSNGLISRSDLVCSLYDDILEANPAMSMIAVSKRYQSGVKTLSRLRIELESFFGDLTPPGFQWLPWCEKLKGWLLFSQGSMTFARC
jgi:hypothetical protein